MVPVTIPPYTPSPEYGGRKIFIGIVLVQRVPLVDDVVGPATDERRDGHDDHPVAEDLDILARTLREPGHDEVRRGQTDRIADAIPADGQWAELERRRVRQEVEHPRKCSGRRSGADAAARCAARA